MTVTPSIASVAKDGAPIKLSRRLPPDMTPSELTRALEELAPPYDLTETNPTRVDLVYPEGALAWALGGATALASYEPDAMGMRSARDFLSGVAGVPVDHLLVTASTSEAYAIAIKTFVDPGGLVAVPRPSYPLIPHLAQLEGADTVWYDLVAEERFRIDIASLERALVAGAKLVVIVSPNNPTGSVASRDEIAEAAFLCVERGAVLLIDRVFAAYALEGVVPDLPENLPGLVIALDGLSKRAAMPQLKLAWMALHGDAADALAPALAWVNDAYLSAATPIQRALPALWPHGETMAAQIGARLRTNLATLRAGVLSVKAVGVLPVAAGWSVVIRVPRVLDDDGWVLACARAGVRLAPGYLYDFDRPGFLVASLLPKPQSFAAGARRFITVAQELV